ncbi:hypothetical protein EJ06DRAFT_526322 [Trichodelitschia bisporula]|uniref:Phosphotransferase n=1 Tax=Trichodelitschia bisporula TaxID=703511 RepID=A0A6G1I844_9PEZI|nr:hypothetical protein EJ06DRAFT_526322 [Trichodelitschia bisporula]
MAQIPTYVTAVPNGTEKGLYMAVDLGGTNFRVCSIELNGDSTFKLQQTKVKVPQSLQKAKTAKELFSFLAKQVELFLQQHHGDHYEGVKRKVKAAGRDAIEEEEIFHMGFTFSFPVHQIGINRGLLMRWTKGYDIPDALGKDICALLQAEIDALHLPVRITALINDTVGTLMARSYTSPGKTSTLLGAIFGTGTNGAYVEQLSRLTKLSANKEADYDASTGDMIVNTEWGSFDNALATLPTTRFDRELDTESVNPGMQLFEKRVSGMFLGEILRRALLALHQEDTGLFSGQTELHSTARVAPDAPLFTPFALDSALLSTAAGDSSPSLALTRQSLERDLGVEGTSVGAARAVQRVAGAVGRRAARLAAVAIGAIAIHSGRLETDEIVDVGVDGSLVEFYPGFEERMREVWLALEGIGEREGKIRVGIAKDGSGVGAALGALVARGASAPGEE